MFGTIPGMQEAAVQPQNYQQAYANAQPQIAAARANAYRDWSPWANIGLQVFHHLTPTPCPYCKRTSQAPSHGSYDGCGAPR